MKVRILGSGTSSGVPRIGNDWGDCDPNDPRNRRTRASILVEHDGTRILVDTSPDMRQQLLDANVAAVDAVIWTHEHADHVFGIDDLRQIYHVLGRPVKGYARPRTAATLTSQFGYVFTGNGGYPPTVRLDDLPDQLRVGAIDIRVVDQPHGRITSAGLRFEAGGCAIGYATDISDMTDDMRRLYEGLDIWIVDALRRRPHPTHPDLATVLGWIGELRPRQTALVHMDQSMDYAGLIAELPPHVRPGHDGLELMLPLHNADYRIGG
ncbi:phosphoribosyl 1,2-cyclic phosphate phosphodiesterase [Sphingomonas sp. BE138]|uniref:MBL fold metallo-hydrolase n=1 Tax=Sphingomonas sp. BE138 TaxID=2817845 RepID=UPI002860B391|nr:MBL fold metallo-hydrolase [Sphingomonas sp. BE138]MDR6787669.1 phosphoribosyl 1,2-cyclic phosphate phosphodiesterase [Sphingomonas sp. BE138]